MKRLIRSIVLLIPFFLFSACSDSVEDYYAHVRAFFKYSPVSSVHPLHAALNNPGIFCQITLGTHTYDFKGTDGSVTSRPITALEAYGKPECVAGFVVGISSVPDMNMGQNPVAYDLVCPSCYEETNIQRSLVFSGNEELTCPRCHRAYDLTNGGWVKSGTPVRLYRYHILYANDLVWITN